MNRYETNYLNDESVFVFWEAIWIAAYEDDVRKTRRVLGLKRNKKLPEEAIIELKKKILTEASNWSY